MRRRPDVANQPAGSGKRQRGEIDTAEADLPAGRRSEPRQQLRHQILAAIARPDQRDMSAERETEAESIEQADAVAVDQADIAEFDFALRRLDRALVEQETGIEHVGDLELLDDLLVLDRDILLVLVEIEQFLPRRRQLLIGGEHRHQRAERQFADNHEVAADHKKEERRQLVDQVVEEFDEELAVIDVEADVVDLAEAVRDVGQLVLGAGIGADLDLRGDRLADAVGQGAHLAYPLAAELADAALHLRDEIGLHRIERDRRGAEQRVLHEHEDEDRQQCAGLRDRQCEGIADKAADRLQLGGQHRDDLAGRRAVEMVHRKAKQALKQIVAQAAQHALADPAFADVQVIFEPAVDQHEDEKDAAQQHEIGDPMEFDAEDLPREVLAADRLVDDHLRQFERVVQKRERQQRDNDEVNLFAQAVAQDETIDRGGKRITLRRHPPTAEQPAQGSADS